MEGLIASFRDACKRESLQEIKACFIALVTYVDGKDSFLNDGIEEVYSDFGWHVDSFFEDNGIEEDGEKYLVKVAFETVCDWRPLTKRVTNAFDTSDQKKWWFLNTLFDDAGDLTTAKEAREYVERQLAGIETSKRVAEVTEECWREDEAPSKKKNRV